MLDVQDESTVDDITSGEAARSMSNSATLCQSRRRRAFDRDSPEDMINRLSGELRMKLSVDGEKEKETEKDGESELATNLASFSSSEQCGVVISNETCEEDMPPDDELPAFRRGRCKVVNGPTLAREAANRSLQRKRSEGSLSSRKAEMKEE